MNEFQFTIPQTIKFGNGSLTNIPEVVLQSGSSSVFLISDQGLAALGVVDKVSTLLTEKNISCTTYLDVSANPTIENVRQATEAYLKSGASCIVTLGGGSPMDVAKAVGVLASFGGEITDYEGNHKVPGAVVPIIAVPTTAGTGSEVTASAVITDPERNYKFTVFSYALLPKFVILDPELIMTMPASIAAACGLDALIHALEAYLSRNANVFSDSMAEKAMDLIGKNLRRFVANRQDKDAACAMMMGSTFAGIAFAWARLGNIHAMSHPVSAFFHVPHGVANSILLPTVLEYNALADNGRYETIFNYIREGTVKYDGFVSWMLVDEIKKLNKDLGIPKGLSEVGVTEESIEAMAQDAMKSANILANPRQTTLNELIGLYKKAM